MNILYIEHYAGSPYMGMEFRPYYLSREWVKAGHNVTIMAGDFSHLRRNNPKVEKDFETEVIDGIEYVWLKTGEYEGNGLKRALTMERFVRKLLFNAKMIASHWKPNVVIASSTYPLDTYPAQKIAKLSKAKYIHEVHDMWPSTLYELGGMSKKHPFVVAMQIAENSAYRNCDYCVSLLPYAESYMKEHGLKSGKFVNIQNGIIAEEWRCESLLPEEHRDFFKSHSGEFVVGYFGGHALSNSLDVILNVAKQMAGGKEIFVLVGKGVEKDRLMNRVKEEQISNVFFLPPVDKKDVPSLLENFDCTIMTGKESPLYRFGLALNKMYDSMMSGKPIVCAIQTPNKTLVEEYHCGFQINSNGISEIVNAIMTLEQMPLEERLIMGENGKKAVLENFTYEKLAEKFAQLF